MIRAIWVLGTLVSTFSASADVVAPAQPVGELTLEILMHHMSRTSGVKARFRESKEVRLLSNPIETRGEIFFIPPDRFARHTSEPGHTTLVIDGESLRFDDEIGDEKIDLSSDPIARQFVDNFTVLFNGDLPELRRRYQIRFQADDERWELVLDPSAKTLRRYLRSITLRGDGPALSEMIVVETDGDTTTTRFVEITTNHVFSERELEAAFPGPGSPDAPGSRAP
jgi:hypothetical protein